MANEIITTLHPDQDPTIDLYPNIKPDNIPNGCIDRNKVSDSINSLLNSITELRPSGTNTSTNILAFTSNRGIYVGTDTNHWYYWDGTQYVDGGLYQAVSFSKGDLQYGDTNFIEIVSKNLFNKYDILENKYISVDNGNITNNTGWFVSGFIPIDSVNNSYVIGRPSNNFRICFFNSAKGFISGVLQNTSSYPATEIPENTAYVRICFVLNQIDNVMFEYGQTATSIDDFEIALKWSKLRIPNFYIDYLKTNFIKSGKNLFNKATSIDDKYISYTSGNIGNSTGFFASDWIPIDSVNNSYLSIRPYQSVQLAFYDENKTYISGVYNTPDPISIPNNSKWVRFSLTIAQRNDTMLEYGQSPTTYEKYYMQFIYPKDDNNDTYIITTNEGILEGVLSAYNNGCKKIIVKQGTYDIIEEYKTKYGSTYFDDYTSNYNGWVNGRNDSGIRLDNIEIKFEVGTKVLCNYLGDNSNVKQYFSAFSVARNVIIDGLVLEASELRYGIHPDFNGTDINESYFIVRNCDLSFQANGNNAQTLGCGLAITSNWLFENNIFRNPLNLETFVMRIHNNGDSNAISKVYFKNNYIEKGYFQFNYYGSSEKITNILLSGNSWTSNPQKTDETSGSYDNINIILCNNEIRS